MRKKLIIGIVIILLVCLGVGLYFIKFEEEKIINDTVKVIDQEVDLDNGEEKVAWDSFDVKNIRLSSSFEITKSGIYNLSGSLENGNITINTTGDVKLVFNNISIKNNDGPAINVVNANNVVIELNGVNRLEDGSTYSNVEYDGCIYSKDDIVFQGLGTLEVIGNYMDGIVSSNDIKFVSGTYNIKSNGDGIRGKDSVYIVDGNFNITSGNDGIKSTTTDDVTKGFINIDNGNITINAKEDGIQAETKLIINNGKFNISTGDGSKASGSAIDKKYGGGKTYSTVSSKGIKSVGNLVINDGEFVIDSKDDAIHSNNYFGLVDGNISISSGDDGIHADKEIIIDGGEIEIKQSYEGIESEDITINGGDISVVSKDDGINISGGVDKSSVGGRPGENHMAGNGGLLHITGGKVYVNSLGDGIDSNGKVIIDDGEVIVDGPTNSGNGALDYDSSFEVNGGELYAVGSSGMSQNVSGGNQNTIMFNLDKTYSGMISILCDDELVLSFEPSKKYSSVVVSSNLLERGKEYSIEINDKVVASIKVSSIVNTYGNNRNDRGPGGRGPGGR